MAIDAGLRKITLAVTALLFSYSVDAQVSAILGEWKTVDDSSGEIRSLVRIYKDSTDGLYYGKIVKLYKYADAVCDKCEDGNKDKPVLGMIIISGMKAEDKMLKGGTILDPENGKKYYSSIGIDNKSGKLAVRGSLDKRGLFGRNQYWIK
ncbi:MAG: DUF2147 domain-containing protein [Prevotellaceae bacterium]|jgi:uncharacterized protein (DUF2147 family)|nr:DUF2147 domain-containing protein [Prevotellaceae bacterium]